MNNLSSYKIWRTVLAAMSFIILIYSTIHVNNNIYELQDYIVLLTLIISLVLINKYYVKLKNASLTLIDFIIVIGYFTYGLTATLWVTLISFTITMAIEYKYTISIKSFIENRFIFNINLFIVSTYLAHLLYTSADNIYNISIYLGVSLVIFSLGFAAFNYLLMVIDLSFRAKNIVIIDFDNGLSYVIFGFLVCTAISALAISLYNVYGPAPLIAIDGIVAFISFSINRLDKINFTNTCLFAISDCANTLMSRGDYKNKIFNGIQTMSKILPFSFCGVYFFRENYQYIQPICFKGDFIISDNDLKFLSTPDNQFYNEIQAGNLVYVQAETAANRFGLVASHKDEIRHVLLVPIKGYDTTSGFMLFCLNNYVELENNVELLKIVGNQLSIVNDNMAAALRRGIDTPKSYESLQKQMDYNIKFKMLFTLAVLDIENYMEIINDYNNDFYESLKYEISTVISSYLSPYDTMMCFEKEDIFIIFNLLDAANAKIKLDEIAQFLTSYNLNDVPVSARITYSTAEYPMEGITSEELISASHKKLHKKIKES